MSASDKDELQIWKEKLERYCAYQERCSHDIKKKMHSMSIPTIHHKELLEHLTNINMYNDKRYATFFIQSKINVKKDGKIKIRYALRKKQLDDNLIDEVMSEVDSEVYLENLQNIITKKRSELEKKYKGYDLNQRLMRYLSGKGYSYEEYNALLGF